jgi:hypothetical protein
VGPIEDYDMRGAPYGRTYRYLQYPAGGGAGGGGGGGGSGFAELDGVEVAGGADNVVAGCVFRALGGNGVVVRGGARNGVRSSDFHDLEREEQRLRPLGSGGTPGIGADDLEALLSRLPGARDALAG